MEQKKQEPIRDARQLGTAKMLILGLQHMFAMFGATILVPILVSGYFQKACGEPLTRGLSVSVTLFCAGFGTLIFHLCTKFKVPAFLGSSFAFLGGFYTVANLDSGMYADMAVNDKAAYACGGIFVAGMLYFVLALIIKLVGIKRVMRFLPPVVTGPIIICIGLSLAGSAINNASTNWVLAIIALGVIIIFNILGKGLFKIIPILMGVIISYVVALIMNTAGITNPDGSAILDFTSIASSAWVGIPKFQFMKFDITSILVMAPIAIATMMEHIGDMSAISATVEQNFIADPGLHRTLIGDGIATAFAGAIGGPANTTYGENTGVTFAYDNEVILDNYSLKLQPGKITGIHGASGSGKSTLLKLLMRFWDVQDGSVSVDGTDVRKIPTKHLRDMESYVTQETHLFHDSIANNIAIAKPGASREEIMEAAKKASIHDFIMTLPKGYDTEVGELGDTLAGGEKQRIGIARAFLHECPLILLDEPTSNLDSLNEGIILKSLKESAKKKTVVLVSHRVSTMNVADVVYEMENGRIS